MHKKFLFITIAFALVFASCAKEEAFVYEEEGNNYGVTIDSNGFNIASFDYLTGTEGEVVAIVGGEEILSDLVDGFLERSMASDLASLESAGLDEEAYADELARLEDQSSNLKIQVIEHLAEALAIRQYALANEADITPEKFASFLTNKVKREIGSLENFTRMTKQYNYKMVDFVWQSERNYLEYALFFDVLFKDYDASEKEIKAKFKEFPEEYRVQPETKGLSYIKVFVESDQEEDFGEDFDDEDAELVGLEKIEAAEEALALGEDFAEVAKKYSEDYSAGAGGFIGDIPRGETYFPQIIMDQLYKMKEDKVSRIIKTDDAYYIVKAGKHKKKQAVSYEVFEDVLRLQVLADKMMEAEEIGFEEINMKLETFLKEVRESFDIEIISEDDKE